MSEEWTCVPDGSEFARITFVGSPHLRNLVDRLAHRFDGVSAHVQDGPIRTRKLVILTNGAGIESVQMRRAEITADETLVIGIGMEETALHWAFTDTDFLTVPAEPATSVWDRVQASVSGEESLTKPHPGRPRIFVSHAVDDESAIYPALTTLRRHYGLELFVCADSIDIGADWQDEISTNLRECDLFLTLSSSSVAQSVFCAFEAGMAVALGKVVRVVKLDDSNLPVHLRGRQAIDVPRLMSRKPWLTEADAILDACLTAVASRV